MATRQQRADAQNEGIAQQQAGSEGNIEVKRYDDAEKGTEETTQADTRDV